MNIVIPDDYQNVVRGLSAFRKLDWHHVRVLGDVEKDPARIAASWGAETEAVVLIRERTRLTPELLDRLPNLKLISQTGKISNHLHLPDCTARGIAVAEGVGAPTSTAELTWALIMAAMRHLPQEIAGLKAGHWQRTLGRALRGRRLGIWSYGKIGRLVAGYGKAFGMDVWVWGREGSTGLARRDGIPTAPSREAFWSESDVVSVHLRLTPETRGIVTAADLGAMRTDAVFVNTSRAELVAEGALCAALQAGRPGCAAVDVFEDEPILGAAHPLLQLPNAICTPHLGYVEKDNYELYFGAAFDNVNAFSNGRPVNLANPEVLRR
ncbi:MAG: D-2-hydroxyacid dehydrogenase family protein [Verrucomicrobia bacterium]|nr:D-2-hydroxyacid dehydrogenase family protein [Verrucomicrobiota bacterium]